MREPFYGLTGVGDLETDYQLGGELTLPKPRFTFYDKEIQYHQPDVAKNSCSVHGAMGTVSDLTNYEYSLNERKHIWDEALENGATNEVGWSLRGATDLVRGVWNGRFPEDQLVTFRIRLNSQECLNAIESGYTVYCGYRGNSTYNKDFKEDGVLDSITFGASTYGHAVRMVQDKHDKDSMNAIVDNYNKSSRPNIYTFKKEHLRDLVANGVFFSSGYLFVSKVDFDTMNVYEKLQPWSVKSVEKAIKKGWDKWDEPERIVTKDKFWFIIEDLGGLEAVLFKLGGLTKLQGGTSEERLAVALDRLGLLD